MTIRMINGHFYCDFWWTNSYTGERRRIRRKSPMTCKKNALRWERIQIDMLEAEAREAHLAEKEGRVIITDSPTMEQFCQRWMQDHAKAHCKLSTWSNYQRIIDNHIVEALGDTPLHEVERADIDAFVAHLLDPDDGKGLSRKTVSNVTGVLSKIFERALAWEVIAVVPVIETPKVGDPDWFYLEQWEAKDLVECAEEWITPLFMTALQTGMRFGELAGLQWRDLKPHLKQIDVERGFVHGEYTTPKSHHKRTVPITQELVTILTDLRCELPRASRDGLQPIFTVRNEGEELVTYANTKHAMLRAYRNAEIPSYKSGWHILRHTYASHLAMKGLPMRVLQQLLGHSTVAMTERYAHLAPSATDAARDLLLKF